MKTKPMLNKDTQGMIPQIRTFFTGQPVEKAWLFGSYSRGEETPKSDVDILVKYKEGERITLMTIARMMVSLGDILKKPVDLVEEGRLLPFAAPSVERDKILIYERED